MNKRKPTINPIQLLGIFAWSGVWVFLKITAISWYAYYALSAIGANEFRGYLPLAMWALSIFGLWQATEMFQRWANRFVARMEKHDQPSPQD